MKSSQEADTLTYSCCLCPTQPSSGFLEPGSVFRPELTALAPPPACSTIPLGSYQTSGQMFSTLLFKEDSSSWQ